MKHYSKLAVRNISSIDIIPQARNKFRKEMKEHWEYFTDEDIDELQEIVHNLPNAIIWAVLASYK